MKLSRRARRIQRHYRRMHRPGGLNLVSLMDIFTILVFFLMVNSSEVKVLRSDSSVSLPVSSSEAPAVEALTILVTDQAILLEGREVVRLDDIDADRDTLDELAQQLEQRRSQLPTVPDAGLEITVLAGHETRYRLLRKIMQTCVNEHYRQVRLAVETQREVVNG
ncbi:MAG: biopolymer transporter ExbD [Marinobacter sp.]|uniref:ExbD/TolR family protein n=1 Tax=Marinobacter sp. TaxID=50741 RepID=UPI00299E9F67|nr:biopolymer transporter ExbD [Marinobacter sp.]MDX1754917.1 biopolymer transporter ExbD [Marinobacter sp.]